MTLLIISTTKTEKDARITAFSKEFNANLKSLVVQLFYINEAKIADMDMLTMVPLFMKDLLSIMDRGVVFEMVRMTSINISPRTHLTF